MAHRVYSAGHIDQDIRYGCHKRRWRLRRYVRAVALCRSLHRLPLLATLEHVSGGHLYSREELYAARHGWRYGRRYACAAYGHLPHRRDYERLRYVHAADDCEHCLGDDYQHLRAAQHLRHASCSRRQAPYSPHRPLCADTDEDRQRDRARLHRRYARHAVGQAGERYLEESHVVHTGARQRRFAAWRDRHHEDSTHHVPRRTL